MSHASLFPVLSASLALAAVLGLILLAGKLLRVTGLAAKTNGRLALQASLSLDARRRLLLVRAGHQEFLLLTGGAADLVVGEIGAPEP